MPTLAVIPHGSAATTSTHAANDSRNFQIAPGSAWSRLLQVQGFGQRYEDASGATLGTICVLICGGKYGDSACSSVRAASAGSSAVDIARP